MAKVRIGKCSQCGACCDNFRALHNAQEMTHKGISFIMGAHFPCYRSHFENGKSVCEIYETRPEMCRDFPWCEENLIDFPECSFKFVEEKEIEKGRARVFISSH